MSYLCRIDDVRRYYGEGVGFYFAFLEMLTWALLAPTCIGLVHSCYRNTEFEVQILFCVLYMLWAFLLMEVPSCWPIFLRFLFFFSSTFSSTFLYPLPLMFSFGRDVAMDSAFSGTPRANMEAARENHELTTGDR